MNLPRRPITLALAGALLAAPLAMTAQAEEPATVRFSVPPWPGVTVKTELASQLLNALGYESRSQEVGSTITYQALGQGELDAYLAAWLPAQQGMYDTAMQSDNPLVDLGTNVDGARLGFVVPTYIHDEGYTSAEDLCSEELRDKAGGTLYSIEVGSGTSNLLAEMQDNGTYCLDEWELSETSTPGMLSQARAAMAKDEWIVFYAWTPHWMTIEYDIRFLDDPEDAWGPDGGRSDVISLVTSRFAETNPNATRLLDQLVFSADDQSAMIYGFSFEERPPEEVALEWLRDNPERVKAFLEGVTTRDGGKEAWPVIQETLEIPDA
ncbi:MULTISPECIES: ABC transporter substrate-binding protein [unclassified Halomonas]|uniref:ABC transporter substrate-binding protein n=1 Tax=unclassified Halomonas TaxID=2609666 RepID=UPI002883D10C|nr:MULTISPECIES: ABC transporter substrate-binding protein [unclassified Halomonas]MDT0500015.1 ABC transporter substrate-binding protein [Halomonas sp. PAR7]MDT0512419.1 ABC transporter substrate-binding protein [Halomonas sp. LES1]MDT0591053.1 ABC transporter substrate-binding protein [Halomonas sp. PAR8]